MSRLPVRLEGLPRRALLELAAAGCAADARLAQRADVLLHQHQPLPKECVDAVLLSPDLLPHLFETLELCDWAAAAVCSRWAAAWAGLLQTWGAVQPKPLRVLRVPWCNYGIAVMPDSSVCVADEEFGSLKFVTPEGEELTDGGKWHELTQAEFWCPTGLLVLHGTELLVADHRRVRKLRLSDGAELARSPALPGSGELALAGDRLLVPRGGTLSVLDAETLSLRYEFGNFGCVLDCAVHGNEARPARPTPSPRPTLQPHDDAHRSTRGGHAHGLRRAPAPRPGRACARSPLAGRAMREHQPAGCPVLCRCSSWTSGGGGSCKSSTSPRVSRAARCAALSGAPSRSTSTTTGSTCSSGARRRRATRRRCAIAPPAAMGLGARSCRDPPCSLVLGLESRQDVDEEVRRWAGRRLVVLELDGSTRQLVRLPRSERLYGMHLHGDELHLTDSVAHAVHVHRILGPTHCP